MPTLKLKPIGTVPLKSSFNPIVFSQPKLNGANIKLTGRVSPKKDEVRRIIRSTGFIGDINNMSKAASTIPCEYESSVGQEKTAASFVMPQGLANGFWTAAGTVAAGGLLAGAGAGLDMIQNRINKNKYEIALQQAIKLSPTLQAHGYNKLVGYLPMITKASPTVAEEPRLLANYLESMLDAEGHMNLATFGELTALEGNVLKNNDYRYNLRNELVGGVAKGMTEGTGKAFGTALANSMKARYGA